jgi:hypothetical protein
VLYLREIKAEIRSTSTLKAPYGFAIRIIRPDGTELLARRSHDSSARREKSRFREAVFAYIVPQYRIGSSVAR